MSQSADVQTIPNRHRDVSVFSHPRVSRRVMLMRLASTGGVALLAACASPSTPTAGPVSTPAPPPVTAASAPTSASGNSPASGATASAPTQVTLQPRAGGTLRHAIPADVTNLEPSTFTPSAMETTWLVFDRLTIYDLNLKPQPMLAESWDLNSDYTQFKLNLRKGVQFHTGRELTSDDIKYSLLRVRDPKVTTGALAAVSNWFNAIETPDKYTVMLTSDTSRPAFFDGLEILNIVDQVTAQGPDAQSKIVGTGPFMFVEWAQGDHLSLAKNTSYWQSGRPYLDGVVTNVRNQSSMALQLEGGNLDLVRTPAVDDFVRLKGDTRFQGLTHPNPGTILEIGMNAGHPPFDDKRVRQAMNYAMNRARFADTAFKGTAQPLSLPWMPSAPAYDAARSTYFSYDLDKAQSLLTDAGVSGFATDIIISNAQPALSLFSQILQTDLASIGITMNITNVDQAVWGDLLVNKRAEYTGFWGGNDSLTNEHPAGIFTSPGWRTVNNHSNFQSDDWNQIVATVSSETDPTKQKAAFASMNDFLLDQCFTLAATTNPITFVATQRLHDVGYLMHLGALSFTDAWLDS